ncbi:aminotransferase class I/II-fold pyridoxal phosphate-dependent enzyme [Brevundimonas sp. NIBR11]|uniref:DegT/DnrJ/EryC1/StrS family aminotransferase n=1 Tax=Brevundimonas sp. NIBR11 TaxID=3015999 RepID=UPI0022F07B10|nr:aminotransferase class I/II-fold pyridoxal phosphate-dependent enzyme [Brevundimonas sp. NIBR11]WGM29893.1 Putative pyridoxal phosphate-dependent aminotransferase EpsN [Brevundimonas sp. NIBR11]
MTQAARIPLSAPDMGAAERARLLRTFDDGWVSSAGPVVEAFERAFAEATGFAHATAMSSGTAALQVALTMLDLRPGDAVICPTLTFIGGVSPVVHAGARPIFVDCAASDWNLNPVLLEQAFDRAGAEGLTVRAVVPADLYGQCCDIAAIRAVADAHGVPVILDSAEAVGATFNGRHAGHGAQAAAFSFNGNKIITTGGGGMLASDDADLIARARNLAAAARLPAVHYEHAEVGFNYRMLSLAAAVGLAQLETLEARVARRRAIFARYQDRLGSHDGVAFAPEAPGRRHTRWLTVMLLDPEITTVSPEHLRLALEAADIEARPVWKPMHLQPVFRDALMINDRVAEVLFATGLCLPSGSGLTDADIDRVCDVMEATLRP